MGSRNRDGWKTYAEISRFSILTCLNPNLPVLFLKTKVGVRRIYETTMIPAERIFN